MPLATVSIKPFNILGYSNKEAGQGVLGGESRVESNEKEKRRCFFFKEKMLCQNEEYGNRYNMGHTAWFKTPASNLAVVGS